MARHVWENNKPYTFCDWCGKKYPSHQGYLGASAYCSRRCYEKAKAQKDQEWEETKQKIRDSGGFFSWLFRTILKVVKWAVIIIVFLIVWVLVEGK